ncbi:MAG: hypothetical protein WKF35_13225 [Ferruginibacter sp.]
MPLNNKPVFNDKNTRDKIDLHLRDINDEISEEDIANVKTDVTPDITESEIDAVAEADHIVEEHIHEDEKKDNEDGNNSNTVESSWDILK